jgi:hypothetical protein
VRATSSPSLLTWPLGSSNRAFALLSDISIVEKKVEQALVKFTNAPREIGIVRLCRLRFRLYNPNFSGNIFLNAIKGRKE